MSQKKPVPHICKVYGYKGEDESRRLVLLEQIEHPTHGSAERYASRMRKMSGVSSVCVSPKPALFEGFV